MKKSYDKIINNHYNKVATNFKKSKLSTMNDIFVRNEETKFIIKVVKNSKKKLKILDIGCGNGYTLSQISNLNKHRLFGMENNILLYNISNNRLKKNANISHGDIRVLKKNYLKKFDLIILQRVLINILNKSHQKKSLLNALSYLKKNGKLIVIECFESGLKRLNNLRSKYGLNIIHPKFHNKYLSEKMFKIKGLKKLQENNQNLSKHFFNSRFLDAIYLKSKNKKNFTFNSKFTLDLDKAIIGVKENFSHLQILLFRKN